MTNTIELKSLNVRPIVEQEFNDLDFCVEVSDGSRMLKRRDVKPYGSGDYSWYPGPCRVLSTADVNGVRYMLIDLRGQKALIAFDLRTFHVVTGDTVLSAVAVALGLRTI
jgi:hypothetical protein